MKDKMKFIDFRSDTVTKPSLKMREVMAEAEVGDDVYGDDPTVNLLELSAAEIFGKEAAIFAPSGTQANLLALLSHCERGDEYIVGQTAHTYKYEGGGGAVLGSIQPQPINFEVDGTLALDQVIRAIKPDDFHFAKTRLLCLENTQNGQALPIDYLKQAQGCARQHGLKIHLDGARICNAAVKCGVDVADISRYFDSVSVCLSKGLGAPVGSVLCGDRHTIAKARRWRKMLGGGMRQSGILAAAGLYALENNRARLQQDHDNAELLAEGLGQIECLGVEYTPSQTNMVYVSIPESSVEALPGYLYGHGVRISSGKIIRLVTHLDILEREVHKVVALFKEFYS